MLLIAAVFVDEIKGDDVFVDKVVPFGVVVVDFLFELGEGHKVLYFGIKCLYG